MRKNTFFLYLVLLSAAIVLLSSNKAVSQNSASSSGESQKEVSQVESVVLEKDSAFTWCPVFGAGDGGSCPKKDLKIKVATRLTNNADTKLAYYYIPSGGIIVGEGPNIIWDLSETGPGRFTITVGVGIGDVLQGKTLTQTFTIEVCPHCDPECVCPSLEISNPVAWVKAGASFVLTAPVRGGDSQKRTYHWSISEGEIIAGQNTPRILIKTVARPKNKEVKVTLEIGGTDPACNCPTTASKTISVILEDR